MIYNTDNPADVAKLMNLRGTSAPQVYPRRTVYGTPEAVDAGLYPMDAVPDVLIQPDQYDEALAYAHEMQTLPIYHMHNTWRPPGTKYNQNGLGYCWTWSGTGCLMTTRAMEDKETVILSPVSMGYLVGWANRGNYLESFIKGAREDGIYPGELNSLDRNSRNWPMDDKRKLYRLDKVWDTQKSSMTQHCISGLCYGRSGYIAYNWWGHALELVGIRKEDGKLLWDISNSHNEPDVITLTGSKAIPDECYFFVSTVLA